MKHKYHVLIYRKKKTHLRLDVLLFFFYAVFLHFILKNEKFYAKPGDYEYLAKLENEVEEAVTFGLHGEEQKQSLDERKVEGSESKDSREFINRKGSANGEEEGSNREGKENTFKPIIIGKYNLIYLFYSIEFVGLLLFIFFHVLTFLLSQWNLSVNLFISFSRLNSSDKDKYLYNVQNKCTHVYIKPLVKRSDKLSVKSKERFNTDYNLYKPKSELVPLKRGKNYIFFFYKHKKYIFNYETLDFESVKHFDNFNLCFYQKWKGLIEYQMGSLYDDENTSATLQRIEENVKNIEKRGINVNTLFCQLEGLYLDKSGRSGINQLAHRNKGGNRLSEEEIEDAYDYIGKERGSEEGTKIGHSIEGSSTIGRSIQGDERKSKKRVHPIEGGRKQNVDQTDPFLSYYKKSNFEIPYDIFVHNNLDKYGENIYDIPSPCFKKLLYEAMLSPFFIFQFFSILLWMLDSYWYFGIFSIFILVMLEGQLINKRIREFNLINSMKVPAQNVYVYRNLQWKIIKSNMLLPGDIYILSNETNSVDNVCTCETLLLEGVCITDESILTGESIPLIKASIDKTEGEEYIQEDTSDNDTCCDWAGHSMEGVSPMGGSKGNSIFTNKIDIKNKHKKHVVYAGSKILLTKNENDQFNNMKIPINGCIGIVLKNGFTTYQGKLVRTIINTSEKVNSSSIDSIIFLFILLLFSLSSCAYVIYSVLQSSHERNLYKLLLSVSHIITAVIPPEFPITLSLGVTISIVYLYNLKIYCTEPFRLPFSGKSNICAFDKTGTLTEDNMIILGLFGFDKNTERINEINESIISKQRVPFLSVAVIAGCHSICTVNNKLLGDPLEKNSFQRLKCMMRSLDKTYVHTNNYHNSASATSSATSTVTTQGSEEKAGKSLGIFSKKAPSTTIKGEKGPCVENFQIYKRFFFSSELQRMTCIILHEGYECDWYGEEFEEVTDPGTCVDTPNGEKNPCNENVATLEGLKKKKKKNDSSKNEPVKQYLAVSKGSPEMMKKFLKKIPANYDQVLNSLSIKGYRVICLAANVLDSKVVSKNVKREDIEKDLHFCGFLTFICPIKASTPSYILDIKQAGIKNVMITGDNALTACQVSQDVNIVPSVKVKDILILKLRENYALHGKTTSTSLTSDGDTFNLCERERAIQLIRNLPLQMKSQQKAGEKLIKMMEKKKASNVLYFINRENKKMLPFIECEEYIKLCEQLFTLCITGDIIEYFLTNYENDMGIFDELIKRGLIFCRVSPKNKEIIIKTLNKLGNITIMCGDGTNDMAALKAAHVGVSLLSIKISYKSARPDDAGANMATQLNGEHANALLGGTHVGSYPGHFNGGATRNYEHRLRSAYDNLNAQYNAASASGANNLANAKYYEQMKLYNERKKQLEHMMQSMDDSLPLIKLGEASIASPFTYKGNDIKCVKEIICCGRCALSKVIMMYKLMIINSLITAFSVSILTLDGVKLSDAQTTVISLLYTSLIVLISKTAPLKNISNYSPPNSLFNISVMSSLISQVFVHFSILIYGWKLACSYRESDYIPDLKGDFSPNLVNTCIYYLIYCINLSIFSCNYEGLPFMTPIHKNKEIVYIFGINFIFLFALVMNIIPYLNYFFSLVSFPNAHLQFVFLSLMILDVVAPYLICGFIRRIRLYAFERFGVSL
ncbi:cation transporting ATPase, putative [Plasmodium knowlesi strain H]|uniref:Cation transporting ATPase, putative n=3 Tax=Plasmodium knowlesi TaxID=5850 RepID=A0A5K1V2M4_PLAKH|nr:cation transporting ATPase, putative [Plasmodium knowlesi strain H]OTN66285.1 putative Cation transporting ATPase [Plasmodium knowlesi]CAA9986390.1 cation transporting ATPase, putative [Plasmodium knowlesi strain H]SBO25659.1 cation transporting ATPase, putative [Plasmodium knowlesi strain H]SBO28375.1 cation transporting ATPase, putative [Plasmodium knowlesi strain H]VVS75864.1 cation transporting ATPase, putative [Plasmodium knowlesi strain H]|eukprot:XP_002257796.1 integral membrane protein, putative [Plasmodium knowlesi strain H]